MRKKGSLVRGTSAVVFLANLTAFAALAERVFRRLQGGLEAAFQGRNVCQEKLTALTSQRATVCWNKSTE